MPIPRPPHLRAVDGGARPNPPDNPYKVAFVTAIVTGVGTILATLGVQWVVGRASRRNREEEERLMRQQIMLQPMMPLTSAQQVAPPPGYMLVPAPPAAAVAPSFPAALTFPAAPRRRRAVEQLPANGAPPAWFSKWAKQQDARFQQIEAQLASDDGDYEDDEESA